jgi:hypothetical protein
LQGSAAVRSGIWREVGWRPRSDPWDWTRGHDVIAVILIAVPTVLGVFRVGASRFPGCLRVGLASAAAVVSAHDE